MSIRDRYVFGYANYLHSDSALWQLTITYMYSCGEIGTKSADEVLLRVPLRLVNESSSAGEPRIDAQIRAGEVAGILKVVNESCLEFQREHVRRTVCKVGFLSVSFPAFNTIGIR
jgi:nuclear pore complex protein Nup85